MSSTTARPPGPGSWRRRAASAERLEVLALRSGDEAGWIGLRRVGRTTGRSAPSARICYDGTAGIVLFLVHLGAVTGELRYRRLAAAGARNLRNQVAALPAETLGIGAFNGWAGLIYLYSHLAFLWDQPQMARRGAST